MDPLTKNTTTSAVRITL